MFTSGSPAGNLCLCCLAGFCFPRRRLTGKRAVSLRSVTDPRDGRKVALKKMPNVFQNLVSCKRVFRELRMLCFFKHDNVRTGVMETVGVCGLIAEPQFPVFSQVLSALDILQPPQIDCFEEMYPSGPRRHRFISLSVFSFSPSSSHLLSHFPRFLTVPITSCFLIASFSGSAPADLTHAGG